MTKMFGNLTTEGLEETGDRLGGGALLETGVYTGTVKLAYAGKSQISDAQKVAVHIDINGTEFREDFYVTNRNGENSYQDKRDPKKKHPLPGFSMIDDLCLVTTGFGLADQDIEEKVIKLYDFEAKRETPQNVPVLVDLLNQPITVAIVKQTVDKRQKADSGEYVATGETRDENVAEKFFHVDTRRTVTEIKAGIEEATFIDKWEAKNAGKTRNKSTGGEGRSGAPGAAARPGVPRAAAPGAPQAPKKSLFGG